MTKGLLLFIVFLPGTTAFAAGQDYDWPVFRGNPELSGRSAVPLPDNPAVLWTFNAGARSKSSPVVSSNIIFFGTDAGSLVAVNADGKLRWKSGAGSAVEAPPLVSGDNIIYSSSDGTVRSALKESGRIIWSYKTGNQIAGSANIWNIAGKSGIVVGSYDFYLHCISPESGKPLWKVETENFVNGTPAISNGRVLFGGCDGILRIVNPLTGRQTDTINAGVYIASSPAIDFPYAYVGDYEGTFYKVDISAGKMVWKKAAGSEGGSIMSIPSLSGNKVLIGSDDNNLYCFDSATGNTLWSFRTNGSVRGSPVIAGDKVLFGSNDGYIYIVGLNDGKRKWSFNCGSPVSSTPAVTKNRFYVLTEEGRLIAFGVKQR